MTYYVWFSLFAVCAYLIAVDENVSKYVILLWKEGRLNYEKLKWWILYSPTNPIVRYTIKRRANKLARELFNELKTETDDGLDSSGQSDKLD